MMTFTRALLLTVLAVLITACSSYQTVSQVDDGAYLSILGEPSGELLTVDSGTPVILGKDTTSFNFNGTRVTKIKLTPGVHEIRIEKDGMLILNKKIYLTDGESSEVRLR
jgi:hypothetical protein